MKVAATTYIHVKTEFLARPWLNSRLSRFLAIPSRGHYYIQVKTEFKTLKRNVSYAINFNAVFWSEVKKMMI